MKNEKVYLKWLQTYYQISREKTQNEIPETQMFPKKNPKWIGLFIKFESHDFEKNSKPCDSKYIHLN